MKSRLLGAVCACIVSVGTITSASAVPISFTYSGTGSGSIDGSLFTDADFVFSAMGDTDNRNNPSFDIYNIIHSAASIDINGIGVFNFITNTITTANNNQSRVIMGDADFDLALILTASDAVLSSWDMLSSVGPLTGVGSLLQWDFNPITTDGGVLVLNDNITSITFTATVVPVPPAVWLFGSGLLGMIGIARRKKAV